WRAAYGTETTMSPRSAPDPAGKDRTSVARSFRRNRRFKPRIRASPQKRTETSALPPRLRAPAPARPRRVRRPRPRTPGAGGAPETPAKTSTFMPVLVDGARPRGARLLRLRRPRLRRLALRAVEVEARVVDAMVIHGHDRSLEGIHDHREVPHREVAVV